MADVAMDICIDAPIEEKGVRLRPSLRWFSYAAGVSTCTGALLFCYWNQLGAALATVSLIHEFSSDLTMVFLAIYLWGHIRRTWRLRRASAVSWWSGMAAGVAWIVAGATGLYGQFETLRDAPTLWPVHVIGSLVAVVIVCAHAAYGFRSRYMESKGTK